MKIKHFDPVFFDSTEGKNVLFQLLEPIRSEIEKKFGSSLENLVGNRDLWMRMCTHTHELPAEVYKILSTIQEFGKECFRDDMVSSMERRGIAVRADKSCQFLVAEMQLRCPESIKILESRELSKHRRRFFKFSMVDKYLLKRGVDDLQHVIKTAAMAVAEKRTALGESGSVFGGNMESDDCWQFTVQWCDKIRQTNIYDRETKEGNTVPLPTLGNILLRISHDGSEVEINIDSRAHARAIMNAMCAIIWDDGRQHFSEIPTYDLGPLRDVGFDVLRVSNDAAEKIILNMVEFRNVGENFPTRFGENSKTSDVTQCLSRLKDCGIVESAYFSAFLKNGETVKFGIKPPDNLDLAATHRALISEVIEEMWLMA